MADNFRFPDKPPREVLDYLQRKKLKPSFDYREVWRQEHQSAFTVAKATRLDVLQDIHDGMVKALASGKTFASFQKELTPLLQKKGWWGRQEMTDPLTGERRHVQLGSPRRLKIIYDTNLRTAHAHGQWQRIQRTKKALPYLVYGIGPSKNHRREHLAWRGVCLPADDPFWDTHYPQNGWGCKCRVRQVSQFEYDRLNTQGKVATRAPRIRRQQYVNKRTGEVSEVPEGIDPGWDYNPGKRRFNGQLTTLVEKLNGADPLLAHATVNVLVHGPAFAWWYQEPQGAFPVAVLPEKDRLLIGAKVQVAELSDETLAKQLKRHPELTATEYQWVQKTIDQGKVIKDGKSLIYVLEEAGYVSVVKATGSGKAMFVTSLRRLSSEAAKRDRELLRLDLKGRKQ